MASIQHRFVGVTNKGHEKQTPRAKEEFRKRVIASIEGQEGRKARELLVVEVACEYVNPFSRKAVISHY